MKIAKGYCIVLLVLLPVLSHAQYDLDKAFYYHKVEKYKKMRNAGILLTVGGTILAVIGIDKMSHTVTSYSYYGSSQSTSSTEGETEYAIGAIAIGAGVPLWIVGGHAKKKYQRKLEGITVRLNRWQGATGMKVTYTF